MGVDDLLRAPRAFAGDVHLRGVYLGVRFGLNKILSKTGSSGSKPEDAVEVVRGRYARGEISRKEYEQLRDDLRAEDFQTQRERAR